MLASTWMDMVVGVDIHFEMVPTPAGPIPTPFPNPFIGVVLDPVGLASGLAISAALSLATGGTPTGPVLINCMPATNVGTEAKGMGHILIPPGVAWVPMPKFPKPSFRGPPEFPGLPIKPEDDAISIMGSTTVTVMGSSAVRMGELWMSCGEPLRMPSSTVIAIPKGPLVLIGGPPGVNLLDALLAMIKTKWVAGYLHSLISRVKNARLRNILSFLTCFATGHPVDVASGRMFTSNVDFELPGPMPLKFERFYASSWSHRGSPLGPGWSHSLDQAVWAERGKFVYLAEDGRELEFDTFDFPDHALRPGQEVYEPIHQLRLRFKHASLIEVETHTGEILEFSPLPQRNGESQDRRFRLRKRRARDGHEVALSYDVRGNLEWVRDSAGRIIVFEHDTQNRLTRVRMPHPQTPDAFIDYLRYHYDADGDLVQVVDAVGASWSFGYKCHLMVRETNRNGLSFYFAYDGWGSDAYCVRTWGDDGLYDHVLDYAKGVMTVVTNSLGQATAYKLNPAGLVVEVIDARGGSTKYEYDERTLRRTKVTAPDSGVTQYSYDERGNLLRQILADGSVYTREYDARNRVLRATDPAGHEWRFSYDNAGRVLSRTNPLGEKTSFHWSESGVNAFTDALGQHTQLGYDSFHNVSSITEPNGNTTTFSYDRLGRLVTARDPRGNLERRQHDALGRVVRSDQPDGSVRSVQYDAENNVLRVQERQTDVSFEYRGMNRLAARTQAGTRVELSYDTEDHLIAIQNQHGSVYRFVLDPVGEVVEEHGFAGLRRQFSRDVAGRVTKVLRPEGRSTRYGYDALGRVLSITHEDGTIHSYEYRADGALLSARNGRCTVSFERDALGRVVKETQGEDWVSSRYDALGKRVEQRSSKGLWQRVRRDSGGQVLTLDAELGAAKAEAVNFAVRFERDQVGVELERSLPGGIRARWQRDSLGRPLHREVWQGSAFHSARQYSWESNQRLRRIVDAMSGPVEFTHDALGNLAAARYADGSVDLRMPDAIGNLFSSNDRSDREYGSAGELLSLRDASGVTRFEYDGEGNLCRKVEPNGSSWSYTWNSAGMLTRVTRPDGERVEFWYDALGRRTEKRFRGQVTRWLWDGDVPLHEWLERAGELAEEPLDPRLRIAIDRQKELRALLVARPSNGPPSQSLPEAEPFPAQAAPALITWLFEPDSFAPLARLQGNTHHSIIPDHVGAPSAVFDGAGKEAWRADVGTYGQLRNLQGPRELCPFRFPGQYEDAETGLYYNRYRYYDPAAGQFISQDPIGLAGGLNVHAYPRDPLVTIDPLGLNPSVIALGLSNAKKTITVGSQSFTGYATDLLDKFAQKMNAKAWPDFDANPVLADRIRNAMNDAKTIHFNLEGMDDAIVKDIIGNPDPSKWKPGSTNWELATILSSDLKGKTQFWEEANVKSKRCP